MNQNSIVKHSVIKTLLLFLLLPFLLQGYLIKMAQSQKDINLYYFMHLICALFYLPYFYWFSCAVKFLHSKSKKQSELKLNRFSLTLLINIVLVFNFVFIAAYIFWFQFQNSEGLRNNSIIITLLAIQSLSIISFLYNTYFVIRLLGIEKKEVFFFNNIFIKLIILSHPLPALWIIQTKIRKIHSASLSEEEV